MIELPAFVRTADKLFTDVERHGAIDFLAGNPEAGDEIKGTGGVRKVRVPAQGKGKSGGARVIYFFYSSQTPIYALFVYPKSKRATLTSEQKKIVAGFARTIKAHERNKRNG